MLEQSGIGQTLVSLQSGAREPRSGVHVASGTLVGTEVALFPLPRHVELSADIRVHVLVSPAEPGPDDIIERLLPVDVHVLSARSDPTARVALIRLANSSRYGKSGPGLSSLRERLRPHLAATDVPQALRSAGLLDGMVLGSAVERALTRVRAVETTQARRLVRVDVGRTPDELDDLLSQDLIEDGDWAALSLAASLSIS